MSLPPGSERWPAHSKCSAMLAQCMNEGARVGLHKDIFPGSRSPALSARSHCMCSAPGPAPAGQVLAVPSPGPGPTGTKPGLRLGGPASAQAEAANRLEISFVKACAASNLL